MELNLSTFLKIMTVILSIVLIIFAFVSLLALGGLSLVGIVINIY